MLGDVDRFTVPDPRQYLARMVAQVSEPDGMCVRSHARKSTTNLWLQICYEWRGEGYQWPQGSRETTAITANSRVR